MKCNFCDEKATVFLEQLVGGETKKMSLCRSCAEARGVTDPNNFSLDIAFNSSSEGKDPGVDEIQKKGSDLKLPSLAEADLVCDECGFTITDLKEIGRLGCSSCYSSFRVAMLPMLESMHKGVEHTGRAPESRMELIRQREQLKLLKDVLQKAITEENYEKAGELRDEIQALEAEMKVVV